MQNLKLKQNRHENRRALKKQEGDQWEGEEILREGNEGGRQ